MACGYQASHLQEQNGMLRMKQVHLLQPTAVKDCLEIGKICGDTPLCLWDWKHRSRWVRMALRLVGISDFGMWFSSPTSAGAEWHVLEDEASTLIATHSCWRLFKGWTRMWQLPTVSLGPETHLSLRMHRRHSFPSNSLLPVFWDPIFGLSVLG